MTVWAQASQRATYPPSAAVRFSIADIIFNWPRLTWPVGVTPSRAMGAEDIRDLQDWTCHGNGALCGR